MSAFHSANSPVQTCDRVIALIDMDSFYTQVRLNIPLDQPLAVQQWNGLIAVNHPARKFGISRMDRGADALLKCPTIKLVHVETMDEHGSSSSKDKSNSKVSLERYRRESYRVLTILKSNCATVERASIDESYLDITEEVNQRIKSHWTYEPTEDLVWKGVVLDGSFRPTYLSGDFMLFVGGEVVSDIRRQIFDELGYTCSAGIAHNKMLAKLICAFNKPNNQTFLPPRAIQSVLATVSLRKIRNFGGKLGAQISELGLETAQDVLRLLPTEAAIQAKFGDKAGSMIWERCHGVDNDPVSIRDKPKSMMAAKAFDPVYDVNGIEKWLQVLSRELLDRIRTDRQQFSRIPKDLVLQYMGPNKAGTKKFPMPTQHPDKLEQNDLIALPLLFYKNHCELFPCHRLAIGVAGFEDVSLAPNQSAITKYMVDKTKGASILPIFPHSSNTRDVSSKHTKPKADVSTLFHQYTSSVHSQQSTESHPTSPTSEPDLFICSKCGKRLHDDATHRQEHSDYHVALELSRSAKTTSFPTSLSVSQILNTNPQRKRRRSAQRKSAPISAYFAPSASVSQSFSNETKKTNSAVINSHLSSSDALHRENPITIE